MIKQNSLRSNAQISFCSVLLVLLFAAASVATLHAQASSPAYDLLFKELTNLQVDGRKVGSVNNVFLQRETAIFNFKSGKIGLLKKINGQVPGMVFAGDGEVEYSSMNAVESAQIKRFFGEPTLKRSFTRAVFLFTDRTVKDMEGSMTFAPGNVEDKMVDEIERMNRHLQMASPAANAENDYSPMVMKAFLEAGAEPFFYSFLSPTEGPPLAIVYDPYAVEEVQLHQRMENFLGGKDFMEGISQHDKMQDIFDQKDLTTQVSQDLRVNNYVISGVIADGMDFSAETRMVYEELADGRNWVQFNMYSSLTIDSIKAADGSMLEFADVTGNDDFHEGRHGYFWVNMPQPTQVGRRDSMTVYYHGDLILNTLGRTFLKSSGNWYPTHGDLAPAYFDMNFVSPADLRFVCGGVEHKYEEDDDLIYSEWRTDRPVIHMSFNIGNFQVEKIEADTIPDVTVLMAEETARGDLMENVAVDIHNSLSFYQKMFGPCLDDHFYATEIPYGHGQAFPGLIHLSISTFNVEDTDGRMEAFRAHEVAHQWWGLATPWKSYHDQWISEAFAEYSSFMYVQMRQNNTERLFKFLADSREAIFDNHDKLKDQDMQSGPIILGYRNNTSKTQGDYFLNIYMKGAWFLHMLRNMMMDLNTFDETTFLKILRDFYQENKGKAVSTQDFRKVVERNVGVDVGWFFDQWIYGNELPTYRIATRQVEQPDGQWAVSFKIDQEDVSDDFYAQIPIRVAFEDEAYTLMRVEMTGDVAVIDLPLLPLEPEEISWNEFESVLCRIEEVDWDEIPDPAGK